MADEVEVAGIIRYGGLARKKAAQFKAAFNLQVSDIETLKIHKTSSTPDVAPEFAQTWSTYSRFFSLHYPPI